VLKGRPTLRLSVATRGSTCHVPGNIHALVPWTCACEETRNLTGENEFPAGFADDEEVHRATKKRHAVRHYCESGNLQLAPLSSFSFSFSPPPPIKVTYRHGGRILLYPLEAKRQSADENRFHFMLATVSFLSEFPPCSLPRLAGNAISVFVTR
jgi:hypothetical protein